MLQSCILYYKPCSTRYKLAKQAGRHPPRGCEARISRLAWGVLKIAQMAKLQANGREYCLLVPIIKVNISFCILRNVFIWLLERVVYYQHATRSPSPMKILHRVQNENFTFEIDSGIAQVESTLERGRPTVFSVPI